MVSGPAGLPWPGQAAGPQAVSPPTGLVGRVPAIVELPANRKQREQGHTAAVLRRSWEGQQARPGVGVAPAGTEV